MSYHLVWFKRDLRVHDHAALWHASRQASVMCLYIIEPSLWRAGDAATQHYQFLRESLLDLDLALSKRGGGLRIKVGEAVEVLDRLWHEAPFAALYSHQETGNWLSFQRDLAVQRWCRARSLPWHEFAQFGVVRRMPSRDQWQAHWEALMAAPCLEVPSCRWISTPSPLNMPEPHSLGLTQADPPMRQRGGRRLAIEILRDFLFQRSGFYRGGISSPLSAPSACSRLSAYLAFGCLSLREVVQASRRQIDALPSNDARRAGLTAFVSRLYWHCHFIQKLESEPELEFRNMHRGYDGLREADWNPAHFQALSEGRSGWPLVDACVAMLNHTGWLNFRMRAMLVSVAAYPLWLHWQPVGTWLARQFLDYEPGIHWSQMQMQAGTTGINTTRVYNPIKQARDHDPHGHFVRQWLPALRRVPDAWLFEPWRMPAKLQQQCGVKVGVDIAEPLVDLETATRQAKARVYAIRGRAEVKAAKAEIVEKHGSRKRPMPRRPAKPSAGAGVQTELEF
ncbi:cryptochrome/deoxyribodipyrimidine photo-lyase family protein [Methylomonas koyamae]|uniref:Deoxyribodipyrimidine photolyase n=1 Tax=Methylomonas koyamae TaxID=702114 RepID=A0A291IPE2_9GAMM|nr:FAD-binding domain-containing protein [Methylomonas koyamae]ATG92061.1 deoxyribodipyrimidine photolyase [Methylomonas koyamae]OAI28295.1 deoxyribodipyrimidine photolyase [Methylomonas koyamae]